MAVNRRKKSVRMRNTRTHGWGIKKHRGAGNKGGKGNAGGGKRAKQKKISVLKEFGNRYFGKYGFKLHGRKKVNAINVQELSKFNKKEIDLNKEGYGKLIGAGKVDLPYNITVKSASKKALSKIEEAGGSITLSKKEMNNGPA